MKVGILALQGDYEAHAKVLARLKVPYLLIKHPDQLADLNGLILPGGESTTMLHFLREENFLPAIQEFAASKRQLFGTCAGAILLAKEVVQPVQISLDLLDITIERNAYGRQLHSQISWGILCPPGGTAIDIQMVFIRAPKILRVGSFVHVFASFQDQPVGVYNDYCMLTTFHPELTTDTAIHEIFLARL